MDVPFPVAVILLLSSDDVIRMVSKPVENKLKAGCLTLGDTISTSISCKKKGFNRVFISIVDKRILCSNFELQSYYSLECGAKSCLNS